MKSKQRSLFVISGIILFMFCGFSLYSQKATDQKNLDKKVQKFLDDHAGQWHDWNVPYTDGKVLYRIILDHNYKKALEIGTSTGLSTIWIAWALSRTGGKVITIEIDEDRHKEALKNIREAGLSDFVDARLGDAHQLVKQLPGPFDFVFSDADKYWYVQYFKDVDPKLVKGGCFTAHNVLEDFGGIAEFLDYVRSRNDYDTHIDRSSSSGISVSYKE